MWCLLLSFWSELASFEVENNELAKKHTHQNWPFFVVNIEWIVQYFILFFRLAMFLTLSFPFFGTAKVYKVL
jgi:hypothetical protein